MVGHVVVWVLRDDEVGLRVLDDLDDLVAAFRVVGVDVEIAEDSVKHFDPRELPRFASFRSAHGDELLGRDHDMSERPGAKMGDYHLVAALHAFRESSRAADFNVVGMTTYCKNVHDLFSCLTSLQAKPICLPEDDSIICRVGGSTEPIAFFDTD